MASRAKPSAVAPGGSPGDVRLTLADRVGLYAAARSIGRGTQETLGLRIPFHVYFKDPLVARKNPAIDIDEDFRIPWEPGIADGPTSARFAVVDFDSTAGVLTPPSKWDRKRNVFIGTDGGILDSRRRQDLQFHQVSTWAIVQNTLDYFESGNGLGRRILWGFEGNRLIIVPHAGYGENAYYDRKSKSLQFYYFQSDDDERIFTCLSSDIVNHEFGHAVLDGIRPYYLEAVSPETAAFHEFMGDLTAILMAFRNNSFRNEIAKSTAGDLSGDSELAGIAQQFGEAVTGQSYLRNARNEFTLYDLKDDLRPHQLSQVLTGAMFDIIVELSKRYLERNEKRVRKVSVPEALWYTIQRMQMMAIQPLDLLPPVEVTFRDYALAVLRAEEVANPTDPDGYREMMIEVFQKRGILDQQDVDTLLAPHQVFERLEVAVFHDAGKIAVSRAEAYRFLDDNRADLFIPANADVVVSDVFIAEKLTRAGRRLPKQVLLQYVWREEVLLEGEQFAEFAGHTASLLCGGTLALDENGNVLNWARKPGSALTGSSPRARAEQEEGIRRREVYLGALARRVKAGMVGEVFGGSMGLLATSVPLLTSRTVDGIVRFELTPHLSVTEKEDEPLGGSRWQISS
ncbi:serine protease [Mesorhizobium sp.]|uniref:serine protease n=1 Tax=Mesorhizobium sp. TaxID=1871066 RepID=UPI000FE8DEE7|nr:serine protease [Mesorhizobium sp.]RWP51073.1 MAG: serine protease [Mesorhizobium sp.]